MTRVLLALLLLSAQDGPFAVTLQTKDGNSIIGTIEITQFTLESSLGKTKIELKDITVVRVISGEAIVSASDGSTLKGKISIEAWKVKSKLGEFTVKTEDIQAIFIQGVRPPPAPVAVPPGAAPGAVPPKPENPGLTPVKSVKLGAAITRTVRSADGKKLFLLNASDSKVLVVDLDSFKVEKEIALAGGETSLSLAPGGAMLAAGGKRTVTIVSPAQGKILKTFAVEMDMTDLCAVDDQTVVASAGSQIIEISIPKQAVISKAYGVGPGRLYLSKDGKRIHSGSGTILLPDKSQGRSDLVAPQGGRTTVQDFLPSPDGRFAASPQGMVLRLSRSFVADMMEVTKIEPHWASAWIPASKKLMVFSGTGFVKEYNTESWELEKSWPLGWRLTDAFLNDAGTVLTGIGLPAPKSGGDQARYAGTSVGAVDLVQFEVPK